jgi:hypothetical protein
MLRYRGVFDLLTREVQTGVVGGVAIDGHALAVYLIAHFRWQCKE